MIAARDEADALSDEELVANCILILRIYLLRSINWSCRW